MITKEVAKQMILGTKGKLFSAQFVKKNGELRSMVARTGVTIGVKGVEDRRARDEKFNHMTVYDFNADRKEGKRGGFRTINLNTLIGLKISGKSYMTGWTSDTAIQALDEPFRYKEFASAIQFLIDNAEINNLGELYQRWAAILVRNNVCRERQ